MSFCVLAPLLGCNDPQPSKAPYGAHRENGVCLADLQGCPSTFAQIPCTAPPGAVGLCNDNRLIYSYTDSFPGMLGDYPLWMCFYDATTSELIGQRVCIDNFGLCDGSHMCADTPGTPYCDTFETTVAAPACADAGAPD